MPATTSRPPVLQVRCHLRDAAVALLIASTVASPVAAQQPARTASRIIPLPQSSLVYARDGALIGEIGSEWRTSVSIRTLPRHVPAAFVAVEDKRFYQHDGVDLIGVAAALKDAVRGEARGASTITQLLVGNMHPDLIDRRDRSIDRKLREQTAAREMEKRYSKEQILEAFLNTINFGRNWFGIEAAARHYFGKSAAQLSLAEAASLAALPKSPVQYDPIRHPERNRERRDLVLSLMAQQGMITADAAAAARREPVRTVPDAGFSVPSGYFVDAVRQQVERLGLRLAAGGYRIVTTLDPVLQQAAVVALVTGTARVEARPGYRHAKYGAAGATDHLQGAVVALDPSTGDVRALVGGRNHAGAPFNRATTAQRQPGSAFKPFVYAAALEDTLSAASIVPDTALALELGSGDVYAPTNADGRFEGDMTLREALVRSRNPVAVQLGMHVGLDAVAELAARVGISSPVYPSPASALGASVVRPIELAAAYTAFANDGAVVEPRMILRVEDRSGAVVWSAPAVAPRQVMDPRVAFVVRDMLREAAERGTGTSARSAVPAAVPVAGKTGTTNDNVDVWFVGLTPELVAAVWLGFDRPRPIAQGVAGGTLAAPIWGEMMGRYYTTRAAPQERMTPTGLVAVEFDRITRLPADAFTPAQDRYLEYFLPGTEPAFVRLDPWRLPQWGALLTEQ